MTFATRSLALAVLLAAQVGAATAQETASEPADGNTGELSLGTPTEPQVGQTYTRSEHGDWELRCIKTEDGSDPCQLYQLLKDQEGNSVAEISLFNLPEGQEAVAGATIITPLETLLTQQVMLAVDAAAPKRYPFTFCSQVGCFSRVGFTEAEVQGFRQGAAAKLTIVPAAAPAEVVELTISLNGFTAGFEAVTAANAGAN